MIDILESCRPARHPGVGRLACGAFGIVALAALVAAPAAASPPIRILPGSEVPACVTPERLDAFLDKHITQRGYKLESRFRGIAHHYKRHGEANRVRWDYAFFQMAVETNFLSYRRGNGDWGDVNPRQNNFAGLGTTGGGVPGDSYPDVSTGVLAQIQHLMVYAGERLADPVGPRTRLKQDVILKLSEPVVARRPVTFQDLSGRWAVDRKYGRTIEYVADLYRRDFCKGREEIASRKVPARTDAAPARPVKTAAPSPVTGGPAAPARSCRVQTASFGGTPALLIKNRVGSVVSLTALNVQPGFEEVMARGFIEAHAKGGQTIASFASRDEALSKAHEMCQQLVSAQ